MRLNSEDLTTHDICARKRTWSERYESLRVSPNLALNESIHEALTTGNPTNAAERLLALAANPGIDIASTSLYDSAIHASRLAEVLAAYLLSVGKCAVPAPIECEWGEYEFQSFLLPDGRLRRVVLCDRWSPDREQLERFAWRTAADCAIANRAMLLNVLVIGGLRNGFRASPWTQCSIHPQSGEARVQRRNGENFGDTWRVAYREQTSIKPLEWLKIMQSDGAFDGRVFSITQDVPANRAEVLEQIAQMAEEIKAGSLRQTRASCYRFKPCPFSSACMQDKSPLQLGWVEKSGHFIGTR